MLYAVYTHIPILFCALSRLSIHIHQSRFVPFLAPLIHIYQSCFYALFRPIRARIPITYCTAPRPSHVHVTITFFDPYTYTSHVLCSVWPHSYTCNKHIYSLSRPINMHVPVPPYTWTGHVLCPVHTYTNPVVCPVSPIHTHVPLTFCALSSPIDTHIPIMFYALFRPIYTHIYRSCIVLLSHWDFSHGKFRLPSRGKASCDRVALPNPWCIFGVLVLL